MRSSYLQWDSNPLPSFAKQGHWFQVREGGSWWEQAPLFLHPDPLAQFHCCSSSQSPGAGRLKAKLHFYSLLSLKFLVLVCGPGEFSIVNWRRKLTPSNCWSILLLKSCNLLVNVAGFASFKIQTLLLLHPPRCKLFDSWEILSHPALDFHGSLYS